MTVTRDAWQFYLALAAVVLTYLATAETAPNHWSFKEWVQFLLVGVTWGIGKLQTSPLPGENDPKVNAKRDAGETVL